MHEYEAQPADEFDIVAKRMIAMAKKTGKTVRLRFNSVTLIVKASDTLETLESRLFKGIKLLRERAKGFR